MGDMVTNINIPNRGQMVGLPLGSVVETNAVLSNNRIAPVTAGLERDADLAFRAFSADPLVAVGVQDARALMQEMLRNTQAYLPGWDIV